MLANRRFAIPLIALLAFCFIGLILVGIVLILRPGAPKGTPVAEATTAADQGRSGTTQVIEEPTWTPAPTNTPTAKPSPTRVVLGTQVSSGGGSATATLVAVGTPAGTSAAAATTQVPTAGTPAGAATTAPSATAMPEEELAQTGIGWGLILASGVGLALLAIVARRVRLAS
jgi:hypothetical protein